MKRVLVIGATGLVGGHLLDLLEEEHPKTEIVALTRRKITGGSGNVAWEKVDFSNWEDKVDEHFSQVDAVFVAIGTTKAKTPDESQYAFIDRDIPLMAAQSASANKVPYFGVISSVGADSSSNNFYLRTKGEMENGVREAGVERTLILRPGFLKGDRKEFRLGERIGGALLGFFGPVLPTKWRKYKGIKARTVARALMNGYFLNEPIRIMENPEIEKLADQNP
jgi:uncharacterized protein YbjT (DUF2867 family)